MRSRKLLSISYYAITFFIVLLLFGSGTSIIPITSTLDNNSSWQQAMAQIDEEDESGDNSEEELLLYENHTYGVKIQYPSNWEVNESIDPDPNDDITDIVGFFAPEEFQLIMLQRQDLPVSNPPLDPFLDSTINFYKDTVKDFRLIESDTDSILAGKSAYKLVYTQTMELEEGDTFTSQIMEIGTIVGNKLYLINYMTLPEIFSDSLSTTIQNMIDSFEILVSPSATVPSDEAITLYNKGLDATLI